MRADKKLVDETLIYEVGKVYAVGDTDINFFVDNFGHEQAFIFHGDKSELVEETPEGKRILLCTNYDIAGNDIFRISKFEDRLIMSKPFELFENSSTKVVGYFATIDELLDYVKKNSDIIIKTDVKDKDYRIMHKKLTAQLNDLAPKEAEFLTYGVDAKKDIYIYYINDIPVGMIGTKKISNQTYELTNMFVDEKFRSSGTAKKLICFAEDTVKGNRLVLRSWRKNKVAISFYEKRGFREVDYAEICDLFGREKGDEQFGKDSIFMEKNNV